MNSMFDFFLDSFVDFTDDEKSLIKEKFYSKKIKAKTAIVSEGQRSSNAYFILSGCIRKFCLKDGEEITIQIITEHQFALEFVSFITGEASNNTLETMEDCDVLVIEKGDLEELYETVPKMNIMIRKSLEMVLLKTGTLLNDFIMLSPEERYIKLLQNNPDLLNRLPQHIIASNLVE